MIASWEPWPVLAIAYLIRRSATFQTVGNILRRHGLAPAPKRSQNTTWKEFIRSAAIC